MITDIGLRFIFTRQTICCVIVCCLLCSFATGAAAQLLDTSSQGREESASDLTAIETAEAQLPADEEIAGRLRSIFKNLPALANVQVAVNDGVVVLEGTVKDTETRERAENLAKRLSGVVIVLNDIERDHTAVSRISSSTESILDQLRNLVTLAPILGLALLIFGLSFILARLVGKSDWLFNRLSSNWFLRDLWRQVVQLAILCSGLVIGLHLLDATALLGSVAGALGILGLAIGFATRDTIENYVASILLSIRQPFRHEDHVKINDLEGKVIRLTPRATVLMSLNGNHIRLPNSAVFKANIINYSSNPLRRFEFQVGVDTEIDLSETRSLAIETIGNVPGVLQEPPPVCLVEALGDSSVILKIQAWIDQDISDFSKTRSEAQRMIKESFDSAGIVMPEPIYNVNLRRQKKRPSPVKPQTDLKQNTPKPEHDDRSQATISTDTKPDLAVEDQIRKDKSQKQEEDLLDRNAPTE